MRAGQWVERQTERFGRDRSGNFGMMLAVTAPLLALAAGYGLNIAQMSLTRANLLAALDSAITSTARDLTTGAIDEDQARQTLEAFLLANGTRGFAEEERITLDSVVVDKTARTVSATASVVIDVAFPLFGIARNQRITTDSAAIYSDRKIEVAMMLDVTGSMRGRKLGDLQAAATNAVNLLLNGQNQRDPRVRVAVVPYAEAVNAGALAASTVHVERSGGSDLPPEIGAPEGASTRPDDCATERKLVDGTADFSGDGPFAERLNDEGRRYFAKVNRDDRMGACPAAELVPLTADKRKLLASIDAFRADGFTAGGIAAQWGYYMLSPSWRTAIADAGLGAGPANHDVRRVSKVAILMSDGQFNTAFAGVPGSQRPQYEQTTRSRTHAESICGRMKDDGITVFTIGFDLDNPKMRAQERDDAKAVLRNCASPDGGSVRHYFEASTGEELDAAFREIIANTERLALTR